MLKPKYIYLYVKVGITPIFEAKLGKGPKYQPWIPQARSYTTKGGEKKRTNVVESQQCNDFRTLAKHWWICYNNRNKVFTDLRGLLKLESLWFVAYIKLKKNKGSKTPVLYMENIEHLTKRRILELRDAVLNNKYSWHGTRQVIIPKPGKPGKGRLLGIPTINDRLVQEVIRTVIEPIFELNFNNQSHGFRPNRSCHTALKWIYTQMKSSTWYVEGDIKSYLLTINHEKLMELIERRVKDKKLTGLIREGLKAKIFTTEESEIIPELGTPQGGILSPLLSNVYLHELDLFMQSLNEEYENKFGKTRRKINQAALNMINKGLKSENYRRRIPYYDPKDSGHIKVRYIRYADDFLVGITGSRNMAENIRGKIGKFLKEELKVELSMEKTHITHISKGIPFLGYVIGRRNWFTKQRYNGKWRNRIMNIPLLSVDMNRVISKLATNKLCTKDGDPLPAFQLLQLPQSETNQKINSIIRGLSEWWKIAGYRKRATQWVSYILRTSIAKMYAAKFKLETVAAVFKAGGENLGRPIVKRAKSVVGNDEGNVPNTAITQTPRDTVYQISRNTRDSWEYA